MNWTELCTRASDSIALSQWLLDRALVAMDTARNSALDAVIAAELPTAFGLCEALDAHGVKVSDDVLAKFRGHLAPSPIRAAGSPTRSRHAMAAAASDATGLRMQPDLSRSG
jgi:hypothetical protein